MIEVAPPPLRPLLRAVQDADYIDYLVSDLVNHDVRKE
jgi:hypothetical protein